MCNQFFFSSASPDKFFYDKVQRAATKDLMNETQVGPVVDYSFLVSPLLLMRCFLKYFNF